MEQERFNKLTKTQKLLLIMESGRLVLEKKDDEKLLKLYVYKRFYVEVVYDLDQNKILTIRTPDMDEVVDEYLGFLNIDDILNL